MKYILLAFFFLSLNSNAYYQLPTTFVDLAYEAQGSCEASNLSFNAARFSKINLFKKREGFDVYLQVILFLNPDGSARMRTQEMGLGACQTHPEHGEICSYRPFNDTKKITETIWMVSESEVAIHVDVPGLGSITKIRDDFPWLGFNLAISSDFIYPEAQGQNIIGGKVQVNFNQFDQNVSRICQP